MSAPKEINLMWQDEPNEDINAWLASNNIDPQLVPAAQVATVTDAVISIIVFAEDEDGHKIPSPDGASWMKIAHDFDLLVRPEAFGL